MELNVLGLTDETEHVYKVLVGLPRATASEVAEACGRPASAVGKLLSGLVRDGLATRSAGRPPRFTAVSPDVAVTALIQEREHRLDEARSLVERLTQTHREAARISHPDMAVELLSDRDDISAAVRRLTAAARREIRAFDRPPYVDRPGSNLDAQVQRQRTGVVHRVIYDREAVAWPGRLDNDIVPSIRTGEQARVRNELPLKLVLSDDRAAIIPFSLAPGGQSVAYLIHPSPMLVALSSLFEAQWDRALPLLATDSSHPGGVTVPGGGPVPGVGAVPGGSGAGGGPGAGGVPAPGVGPGTGDGSVPGAGPGYGGGPGYGSDGWPPPPGPETRALLALLAAGLTDAAIARAQGWSERTTQRRIHRLMTELDATTRFQASLTAARRGWL
ncbi:TrmB family transcriptional regulator [Streptomyces sp. NPDC087420]|uniref:TrmB family transcriptional regulator n=1 Tax=Streptomyces sp. NPDC087420 TaxID=3365785 RepID=UPI003839351F